MKPGGNPPARPTEFLIPQKTLEAIVTTDFMLASIYPHGHLPTGQTDAMKTLRHHPQPALSPFGAGKSAEKPSRRLGLAATGGLLGALAASSCCILPLVLFSLVVGGAWLGNLAALAAYQPIFVAVAVGFLVYGFYLVHRRREATVDGGGSCTPVAPRRTVRAALWIATALVAASIAFPYVGPQLLGV